jgi:hypothetical protein
MKIYQTPRLPVVDIFLIILVASLLTITYLAIPTDTEEIYSTLLGSVFMWTTVANGGQPLWTPMLGLGTELPFRFGLFIHPLGPLFAVLPPYEVMGLVVFTHLIIAGLFFYRLVAVYLKDRWWRLAITLSFLATPSIIQPLIVDDWLSNFVMATMMPVVLYAVYRFAQGGAWRDMGVWGLIGGTACGISTATGFPVTQVIFAVLFYISLRLSRLQTNLAEEIRSFLWCAGLIGGITALIGMAQIYSLYHFVQLTPPSVLRMDHPEPAFSKHVLSYLFRAFLFWKAEPYPWRSVWFGTWVAFAALVATVIYRRRREDWGILIPFILSLALMFIPPRVFDNLITNTWSYRNGVDLFGLLLGGLATERFFRSDFFLKRWRCARAIPLVSGLQVFLMAIPIIALVFLKIDKRQMEGWNGYDPSSFFSENSLLTSLPKGRIALTTDAYTIIQSNHFINRGLALNTTIFSGRPSISMESRGVSQDKVFPDGSLLNGKVTMPQQALNNPFLRQFWAVTTVISGLPVKEGEAGLGDVVETVTLKNGDGIAMHVPAAISTGQVAVLTQPFDVAALPLLPECPHDRLLCRDLHAVSDSIAFTGTLRLAEDSVAIDLPQSQQERVVLLPLLWNEGLRAREVGGRPLEMVSNGGLVQLHLPSDAITAVVSYDGGVRNWLYLTSGVSLILSCAILLIIFLRRSVSRKE